MANVKKIILFLFGIVLIVFGNKAAINTIFKTEKEPEKDKTQKSLEAPLDIVTRELPSPQPKKGGSKDVEKIKAELKEKPKPTSSEVSNEQKKEEEKKLAEAPKTMIEAEKAEDATATE